MWNFDSLVNAEVHNLEKNKLVALTAWGLKKHFVFSPIKHKNIFIMY